MYIRQGYVYIHNWVANAVLSAATGDKKAHIVFNLTPMKFIYTVKDEYAIVMSGMYGYVSLLSYILPMYSYILRIQVEKQSGMQRHLAIVGLSQGA